MTIWNQEEPYAEDGKSCRHQGNCGKDEFHLRIFKVQQVTETLYITRINKVAKIPGRAANMGAPKDRATGIEPLAEQMMETLKVKNFQVRMQTNSRITTFERLLIQGKTPSSKHHN